MNTLANIQYVFGSSKQVYITFEVNDIIVNFVIVLMFRNRDDILYNKYMYTYNIYMCQLHI
jgi:hypothetical protein